MNSTIRRGCAIALVLTAGCLATSEGGRTTAGRAGPSVRTEPSPPKAEPRGIPPLPFERGPAALETFRGFRAVTLVPQPIGLFEGVENAPIVIEDFADFRCPHCYAAHSMLQALALRWPGRVKIVHRNFPLDAGCNALVSRPRGGQSCRGALAAACAAEQRIFGKVQAGIFALQQGFAPIDDEAVRAVTESSGGDYTRLAACMQSDRAKASIEADVEAGRVIGIEATPTLVLQGRLLPAGAPEAAVLFRMIDALVYEKEGRAAFHDVSARLGMGR